MGSERDVERMLSDIRAHTRYSTSGTGRQELDERVLAAVARVPRDAFVPEHLRGAAFGDGPLPIGCGQTISQPFIVALMTDLVAADAQARILEVGTGSGYQTAVLAELVQRVYSIEIVPELAQRATALLRAQGYANVETRTGDGYHGWPEAAPFDGILVTAAAEQIPPPLVTQLAPGARLVIPVGQQWLGQSLLVVEKDAQGGVEVRDVLPVAFVPLTGNHSVSG